ncbi:MAG: glycosyltransferase [Planctomycetes bacterium]|nr:glycosyltransferase [Planctomycetota bacterium]
MTAPRLDILYVITDLERGGVPLHLLRLATEMTGRGRTVAVVSLARPGPVADMLRDRRIAVHGCNAAGGWDVRVLPRLARIVTELRPRLVHSLLFHANLAARWAARRAGLPPACVVCEIQTVEVERRWHLLVDRCTHRGCRFTIGNSPAVLDHLARRAGIPRSRQRLVRGGIDPAALASTPSVDRGTLPVSTVAPLVFWAGRLDPVKGLDTLVQAFRVVAAHTPAHLLLAGDGPIRPALERWITGACMNERVHLLGMRRDVPALLKAADVFAFPSRTEGLPNALLEAMAAGCPVVATDVPGCRELVRHDQTGLLVPCGDYSTLAVSILRLLRDRPYARRLAAAAEEAVARDWHIRGTFDAYAAIYDEILADTPLAG